ncbi:hypothetical protein ACU4GD_02375 [Cupriavidus basilensis]
MTGTAATGAALANANVAITDSAGASPCQEAAVTTSALGTYTCTLKAGEVAPFFVVVTDPTGNTAPLVSVSTVTPAAGAKLTLNATPLTTAIVAQLSADGNPLTVVSGRDGGRRRLCKRSPPMWSRSSPACSPPSARPPATIRSRPPLPLPRRPAWAIPPTRCSISSRWSRTRPPASWRRPPSTTRRPHSHCYRRQHRRRARRAAGRRRGPARRPRQAVAKGALRHLLRAAQSRSA